MEPNYILTHQSAHKGRLMTQKLNESPQDKHKAKYGETHQANYLINAKGSNSENKRQLFGGEKYTNVQTSAFDGPVSPFRDQSNKISSIRDTASPVKSSFDYRP